MVKNTKKRMHITVTTFDELKNMVEDPEIDLSKFSVTLTFQPSEVTKVASEYIDLRNQLTACEKVVDEMGVKRREGHEDLLSRLQILKKGGMRQK